MPSIAYKYSGPTIALSVSTAATVGTVTSAPGEQTNYAAFLNTGTTLTACSLAPLSNTAPACVFPTTGGFPTGTFVLGAGMQQPEIIAVPGNSGFVVSAITNSSVAPVLYVTPVVILS